MKAYSSRGVRPLTELDHLALTIGAPEILSVDLLWGGSTKSSVAEHSAFSLAPQSTSAKLRFPGAIPVLVTQLLQLVLLQGALQQPRAKCQKVTPPASPKVLSRCSLKRRW